MRNLVWAGLCFTLLLFALLWLWIAYEAWTAPLLDEDFNVIEDKYGRMP